VTGTRSGKTKRQISALVALCVGLVLSTGPAAAQSSDAPNRRSSATFLGDTGLWFVPTAEVLPDGKWSGSAQRGNFDRSAGITDIQHYVGTFAYGITDRFELFGSLRAVTRLDRDSRPLFDAESSIGGPVYAFPFVNDQFSSNFGDLLIGAKINITSEQNQAPVAFAFRGMVKFPTGSTSNGTSTGKADIALDLIASKDLGTAEVAAYGGFLFRGDPSRFNLPNSFRYGVGVGIPIGNAFSLIAEVNGEALSSNSITIGPVLVGTDLSRSGILSRAQSPADAMVGLQWNGSSGLYVGAGLNVAMVHDDRMDAGRDSKTGDTLGFLFRIGYHPGVNVYVPPPPPAPDPPANRPPTVTLSCDPCSIMVGEESALRADARDPDGDTLEYAWSSPAGSFQEAQNRETQRWQAPAQAGPVPVTVTVNDGRGGTATDTTTITVTAAPAPPAKEYVFEDVHFDFDRYSLRPGAARVLDEVVAALEEDANLRIEIEGHTCNIGTNEYNLALGDRRSNSVQEYLTSLGVGGNRLQTVSYGEERPAHDNSREETRRLNRRAALVVRVQ
jgi:outer membrane protein OmpA-like peptidoglycan-associated protein